MPEFVINCFAALFVTLFVEGAVLFTLIKTDLKLFGAFVLINVITNLLLNALILPLALGIGKTVLYLSVGIYELALPFLEWLVLKAFSRSRWLFPLVICANLASLLIGLILF